MSDCKYCNSSSICLQCTTLYLYSDNTGCFKDCTGDTGFINNLKKKLIYLLQKIGSCSDSTNL